MKSRFGRAAAAFLLLIAFLVFGEVPMVSAWEWYLGGIVGGAFPQKTDLRFTGQVANSTFLVLPTIVIPGPPQVVEVTAKDRSLEPSLLGGAKAGACPPFFPPPG